ncbi:s-cell enriched with leucine-rich repeat-containing protein slra-related [Anaeramoeba flamelloides]|uniref:S-cell enriched with leucine-rich repeat-containing protein slra-related n=1 Tax=Anaeramoeba flamelloides TaxID=1746091 RepID=A0ABQ8YYA6_9EUKA|nr:s-cell enriched with leucine-rich repeat-containing protein slra-related [Anaeramoeba flamelloides]
MICEFDIGKNNLKKLPDDIFLLTPRMIRLFLHENKLKKLPSSIQYLDRVITLFAKTNKIKTIPKEINKMSNLLEINLMNNLIGRVPVELYQCQRLVKLNLSNNLLTELPKGMYQLRTLDYLNLSSNKFTKFPSTVLTLPLLRTLSIGSNEIKAIPDIINELKFLKELNASSNKLYFIPSGLGYLKNFTTLYFSDNKISQIPELFWKLRAPANYGLRIDLSHNRLKTFDERWKLLNLEELDLSHNQIKAIDPKILSKFSRVLETFKISHNNIKDLDLMEFAYLKHLKMLHYEGNQLTKSFEEFVCQFKKFSRKFINKFSHLQQMIIPQYVPLTHSHEVLKRKFSLPKKYRFNFGYSEMQGVRPEQEDSLAIQNDIEHDIHCFAVFDGHGGWQTSNFVADTLDQILFSKLVNNIPFTLDEKGDQKLKLIIDGTFINMNKTLKKLGYDDSGSTACIGLIIKNTLYTVNLGDSRSVLVKLDGETIPVTKDHKPTDRSELDRVCELGGTISDTGRINGGIAVSRSFGDIMYQPYVSCEPTIKRYSLSEKSDKFLVVCCDGVYDVLSNQEVGDIVYKNYLNGNKNLNNIAAQIRNASYSRGSFDNISVVVIDLFPKSRLQNKEKKQVKEIDEEMEMEIANEERIQFGKPENPNEEESENVGDQEKEDEKEKKGDKEKKEEKKNENVQENENVKENENENENEEKGKVTGKEKEKENEKENKNKGNNYEKESEQVKGKKKKGNKEGKRK